MTPSADPGPGATPGTTPGSVPAESVPAEAPGPSTRDQLVVYLRNHDAALLAWSERLHLTARSHLLPSARDVLAGLAEEVRSDRGELARVMQALGVPPSRLQRLVTVVGERLGRLKPNDSWSRRTPLTDVVELEALGVAALGTLRLWQTLLTWQSLEGVGPLSAWLDALDLEGLVARSVRRVETLERLHDESVRSLVRGRTGLGDHDGG